MQLKTGAIYSLYYSNYHYNRKVYAFVLYGGPIGDKVHALNLGAIQLSVFDRYKLIRTIKKLASVPNSSKYDGAILYQIFKKYHPMEIRKCYRTYLRSEITASALINYGLNPPDSFTPLELQLQNTALYNQATGDYIVKLMNLYTGSSAKQSVKNNLAQATTAPSTADAHGSQQQGQATGAQTSKPDITTQTATKPTLAQPSNPSTAKPSGTTPNQGTTAKPNTTNPTGTTTGTETDNSGNKNNNGGNKGGIKGMY